MQGPQNVHNVLRKYWGYTSFRSCQEEVIKCVLEGGDGLVVMATGAGKSMCYQVPPLVTNKVAVVISPLISLMEDQVQALNARGLNACYLGSAQQDKKVKDGAWKGAFTFIYMTPELAANSHGALAALHSQRGICLVAIDEAHCVSEWGHEFRPEYRNLGELRTALPNIPFLALTATANQRVQDDIVSNLQLRHQSMGRWVTGFERTNLEFGVKQRSGMEVCYEEVVQQWQNKGSVEPTLIYALTVNQVKDIADRLEAVGMKVLMYHAQLPLRERKANHTAFLNDDVSVMVATVAYGMGIDKPNIRNIIHVGAPSSLEAYYQQAGRAGRDGVKSRCQLFWSHQDLITNENIKRSGLMTHGKQQDPFQERRNAVVSFCSSTNCRHSDLVNYFQAGSLPPTGPCRGGCDNCKRRATGQSNQKDFKEEAVLLLSALKGINGHYGMSKAVKVLRGSTATGLTPQLLKMRDPVSGQLLHGAGRHRSDNWWKGLATLLVNEGMVSTEAKKAKGYSSFVVYVPTLKGLSFLNRPKPLVLTVPASMQEAPPVSSLRDSAHQALSAETEEVQRLESLLRGVRKHVADCLGHAPTSVVTEATIQQLARVRPARHEDLVQVPGMSEAAVRSYGKQLLQVVVDFCAASKLLSHGMGWNSKGANTPSQSGSLPVPIPLSGQFAPLAKKLLGEPKGAALDAYQRFTRGEPISEIASKRPNGKVIQVSTVVGYIADCAGAGFAVDFEELSRQAGLTETMAKVISRTAQDKGDRGLSAIKGSVEAADYGQVKLTVAMMAAEAYWFGSKPPAEDELDLTPDDPSRVTSSRHAGSSAMSSGAASSQSKDQNVPPPSQDGARPGASVSAWISRKSSSATPTPSSGQIVDISNMQSESPSHISLDGSNRSPDADTVVTEDVQTPASTKAAQQSSTPTPHTHDLQQAHDASDTHDTQQAHEALHIHDAQQPHGTPHTHDAQQAHDAPQTHDAQQARTSKQTHDGPQNRTSGNNSDAVASSQQPAGISINKSSPQGDGLTGLDHATSASMNNQTVTQTGSGTSSPSADLTTSTQSIAGTTGSNRGASLQGASVVRQWQSTSPTARAAAATAAFSVFNQRQSNGPAATSPTAVQASSPSAFSTSGYPTGQQQSMTQRRASRNSGSLPGQQAQAVQQRSTSQGTTGSIAAASPQRPPRPVSPVASKARNAWFYGGAPPRQQRAPILRLSSQDVQTLRIGAQSDRKKVGRDGGGDGTKWETSGGTWREQGMPAAAVDIARGSQSHLEDLDPIPCLTPVQPEDRVVSLSQQAGAVPLSVQAGVRAGGAGALGNVQRGDVGERMEVCTSADVDMTDSGTLHESEANRMDHIASTATSTNPTSPSHAPLPSPDTAACQAQPNTPTDPPSIAYPPVKLVKRAAPSFLGGARKRATSIPVRSNLGTASTNQPTHTAATAAPETTTADVGVNGDKAAVADGQGVVVVGQEIEKAAKVVMGVQAGSEGKSEEKVVVTSTSVRELLESHGPMTATALAQKLGHLTAAQRDSLRSCLQDLVDEMELMRKGGQCMITSEVDLDDSDTMYLVI